MQDQQTGPWRLGKTGATYRLRSGYHLDGSSATQTASRKGLCQSRTARVCPPRRVHTAGRDPHCTGTKGDRSVLCSVVLIRSGHVLLLARARDFLLRRMHEQAAPPSVRRCKTSSAEPAVTLTLCTCTRGGLSTSAFAPEKGKIAGPKRCQDIAGGQQPPAGGGLGESGWATALSKSPRGSDLGLLKIRYVEHTHRRRSALVTLHGGPAEGRPPRASLALLVPVALGTRHVRPNHRPGRWV